LGWLFITRIRPLVVALEVNFVGPVEGAHVVSALVAVVALVGAFPFEVERNVLAYYIART
jgi:hypothetical protein